MQHEKKNSVGRRIKQQKSLIVTPFFLLLHQSRSSPPSEVSLPKVLNCTADIVARSCLFVCC